MKKEKKAFKETLFGKIVGKAGDILTDVPGIVLKAASGDYLGAISEVTKQFSGQPHNKKAKELLSELNLQMAQINLEFARVELEETDLFLKDVQHSRNKEVKLAELGKSNWFHYFVGVAAIVLLGFCLYALVFFGYS